MARMSTVTAEADLYSRMRRCAAAELGPGASDAEIGELAEQYYWDNDDDQFRRTTPEEDEAHEARTFLEMKRIKESGGVPW